MPQVVIEKTEDLSKETLRSCRYLQKKRLTTRPGEPGASLATVEESAVEDPAMDGSTVASEGAWPSTLTYGIFRSTV